MSLAFDTSPVQTIKKVEETRKRKKNEQRSQALGKRRVKVKRGHGQDPWVSSRKKMGKLRNIRKQNRRAKYEAAVLPSDDIAATAAHDDPVSDAAPTTPLIKSRKATILLATPGEDMSRLDLPSPPAFASTPEDDIEPPTLETVTEVPESEPVEEAGDFTINYMKAPKIGRSHTTVNAKKKLRRTKRGQQAQYKWAVSHTASKKDWKNRRRAARRIKTEDHYDMHLPSDAPSYQGRARPKGKWVAKQPTPAKGDCSEVNKDNADAKPAEVVPGRVETEVEAVEDKNIFNALSRKSPRNRGNRHFRRNPRWRRNRRKYQKKKADEKADQPAAAEAPGPAATPVKAAPEAKSANVEAPATTKPAAPQRRPNRRRNRYRKKNNQNRKQEAAKSENKPDQESTAKPEGPAATDAVKMTMLSPVKASGKRANRRRNNRNRKGKGNGKPKAPEQGGQDAKQAPQQQGAKNAQKTNTAPNDIKKLLEFVCQGPKRKHARKPDKNAGKNNKRFVWKAKKRGRAKNNAAAKDVYVPGPTAVDL